MKVEATTQYSPLDSRGGAPATRAVPLSRLRRGEGGRFDGGSLGRDELALLAAMGVTERCELRVCRRGEPCIIQVKSTRLGLSSILARRIRVLPHSSD